MDYLIIIYLYNVILKNLERFLWLYSSPAEGAKTLLEWLGS